MKNPGGNRRGGASVRARLENATPLAGERSKRMPEVEKYDHLVIGSGEAGKDKKIKGELQVRPYGKWHPGGGKGAAC